jgi:hypothetical protein
MYGIFRAFASSISLAETIPAGRRSGTRRRQRFQVDSHSAPGYA